MLQSKTKKSFFALFLTGMLVFSNSPSFAGIQLYNLSTGVIDAVNSKVLTDTTALNFTVNNPPACAGSESSINVFDGNPYSKYCYNNYPFDSNAIVLHYLNSEVNPVQLGLTTASDSQIWYSRNPLNWRLFGSNNGTSWTLIEDNTYSNFLVPLNNITDYEPVTFLSNTNFYSYLKFEVVTTFHPTNTIQYSELRILGQYRFTCPFKGNSEFANNLTGQNKSSSPASTKSQGSGACQNAVTR